MIRETFSVETTADTATLSDPNQVPENSKTKVTVTIQVQDRALLFNRLKAFGE